MRTAAIRLTRQLRRRLGAAVRLPVRLHRDQRGTISIVSLFTLLLLVVLLGLVMNTGQLVDRKVKMQNAADAAAYAGGVVLARNMNSLAFTNHLLSEVFALTAFLREAAARRAEGLTPEILDNWERIGRFMFSPSEFPKFAELGLAIDEKIPPDRAVDGDREMIFSFSEWAAAGSELMLPVFEGILQQQLIPRFQRDLVEATPVMVQLAVDETARRHGRAWPRRELLRAALWRTVGDPVGGVSESVRGTLPVVDPVNNPELGGQNYMQTARTRRDQLARMYLNRWNNAVMRHFDRLGQMSQFSNLWRIFTQGELKNLLEVEYPDSNLPHVLRNRRPDAWELEADYMYVGVLYCRRRPEIIPGVFRNPIQSDTTAFAQIMLFVPQRRPIWAHYVEGSGPYDPLNGGGIPGMPNPFPAPQPEPDPAPPGESYWRVVLQASAWHSDRWDLFNQNWTAQIVPATAQQLPWILSSPPYVYEDLEVELPQLGQLSPEDVRWLTHH